MQRQMHRTEYGCAIYERKRSLWNNYSEISYDIIDVKVRRKIFAIFLHLAAKNFIRVASGERRG